MAKEYAKKLTQLIHLVIRKATHVTNAAFSMTGVPLRLTAEKLGYTFGKFSQFPCSQF
jgi:hypothetical protein